MKKSQTVLFILRLALYFSVITLIFIHPGIRIIFDRIGVVQWLVLVPLMAIFAVIPNHVIKGKIKPYIFGAALGVLLVVAGADNIFDILQFSLIGFITCGFTWLLFNRRTMYEKYAKIAALEPFFLAWVCLRLLSLSRSGEEIAGQSIGLTSFILVWTAAVFLLHSAIIYLCLFPKSAARVWKEGVVIFLGTAAALVIFLVVLPPDFVRNTIIENLVPEKIPQRVSSDSERGLPVRGGGRRALPRGEGGRAGLRGLSEHDWPGRGGGSGETRQYMVKIVVSKNEPVYMGESFRGQLDPVRGFLLNDDELVNELARQRFFVTWSDTDEEYDIGRTRQDVLSISTLRQKYLPYRPIVIDPTILSEDTGPLRYIHQVVANRHVDDPLLLVSENVRRLTGFERSVLASYLDVNLEEDDRKIFETYLSDALTTWQINKDTIINNDKYLKSVFSLRADNEEQFIETSDYMETIIALLTSFSRYQYNLNQDDDHSIESIVRFLTDSKEGDCVEFSNSLALLGRLAGIPSRVVTGYLAAESLQTEAHLRGLIMMQDRIPFLRQFPFDNLFMVTNLHSHSWTQFYIPEYGWLDFESTSFSQPPTEMGDFNNWDVVIPLLDKTRTFSQVRKFPWQAVGRAMAALAVLALLGAYALRYGRELVLYIASCGGFNTHNNVRDRARSLYLLMLSRLAADGNPIKPASKTAHEYRELFPKDLTTNHREPSQTNEESLHLKMFADIYSELRWKQFADQTEMEKRFDSLIQEYHNILRTTKKKGLHRWFIRLLSLRGLAYL